MKLMKHLLSMLLMALIVACGSSDGSTAQAVAQTIDKVAAANGFNALLAAATKAELGGELADSNAKLTVFAPTDAAFNKLATSLGFTDANAMVNALPAASLKSILAYHVLPDTKRATDLSATSQSTQATLYNFEGKPATVTVNSGQSGVTIVDAALTTANVTKADVAADNGVIHVVDKVLVPPGVLNVVQMAQVNPQFSSLVSAVVSANLQTTLSGAGPFTVFAPTNTAFSQAPTGLSTQQLTTVLTYHVLSTQVLASQIPFGSAIQTVAGQSILINAGSPPTITDKSGTPAKIVATDVRASNGVIHAIDKVLIPTLQAM
jgi:uncharacterized surface protein with fasciclin (FAS1) repeats